MPQLICLPTSMFIIGCLIYQPLLQTIQHGFAPGFVNYKKGCTRLTAASIKVYELLAHGRWFSPGTPASSTTKTQTYVFNYLYIQIKLVNNYTMFNFYFSALTWHILDMLMLVDSIPSLYKIPIYSRFNVGRFHCNRLHIMTKDYQFLYINFICKFNIFNILEPWINRNLV
jgi:hypothetical protein